jgi:phage FluMu protein Com
METSEKQALLARWDGFLAKLGERQREILTEAEAGVREILAGYPEDPAPLGNALSGLRFRVDELRTKVNQTWDAQVNDKLKAFGEDVQDSGLDRRDDFLQQLAEAWALFEARMQADFYRQLSERARKAQAKAIACAHCGAELRVAGRAEASSVKCSYCGAINQVMASMPVAIYAQGAGHAFGEEAALPLRHQLERWRVAVERERRAAHWPPEAIESLDRWLEMERACWEKYAAARAQATGAALDRELVESRVKAFMDQRLLRDQRWRKAKNM